jgi:hypothetical protein
VENDALVMNSGRLIVELDVLGHLVDLQRTDAFVVPTLATKERHYELFDVLGEEHQEDNQKDGSNNELHR